MNEEMINKLKEIARETSWSDQEDFNAYDYSGGNYDDAYYGGQDAGGIHLARWILDSMGIEWVEK